MKKIIDITNRYSEELSSINYIIDNLKNRRIYELTSAKMDGAIDTQAIKLEKEIEELINKIEYGKKSIQEEIGECFIDGKRDRNGKN